MNPNRLAWIIVAAVCLALPLVIPAVGIAVLNSDFTETAVIDTAPDQINPVIKGTRVVWQDYRNKSYGCPTAQNCLAADIYLKDISTGTEQRLSLTSFAMDPDMDGNLVVWRDWMSGKIIAHDLTAGTQQQTSTLTGAQQMTQPAVSGTKAVWTDYRASPDYGNIYMRDMSLPVSGNDTPVSVTPAGSPLNAVQKDKRNPDIDGNIVVWEDMRNAYQDANGWWHNPDIYMKDLTTGVESPVCTETSDQYYPVVANNKVYWSDYRNGDWDIYMYDIATATETRISGNTYDQNWASIDGDLYAWKETRSGVEDIYFGRLSTGEVRALTTDSAAQKLPSMDGGRIVWMDNRNGNWDIFMAEDTAGPVITAAWPQGYVKTSSYTVTATYSDAGLGIDPASAVVTLDGSPLTCTATISGVSCPVSGLAQGNHSLTFDVSDVSGNAASQLAQGFFVDTVAPQVTGLQPTGWTGASTTVSATLSDGGSGVNPATAVVTLNGGVLGGCTVSATGVSCPVGSLPEGGKNYTVTVADNAGNSKSVNGSFSVDTTGPVISSLTAAAPPDSDTATVNAAYTDAGAGVNAASVQLSVDGNPVPGCTIGAASLSCDVSGQSIGSHSVELTLSDIRGNPSSATTTFDIVDTVAPVIANPAPLGTLGSPDQTISADFSDSAPSSGVDTASVAVSLDGTPLAGCTASAAGVSCAVSALADGTYNVHVEVSDLAGNAAAADWSFTVSAAAPIISNLFPANGAEYQNPKVPLSASVTDVDGVDQSTVRFYFDGIDVTAQMVVNGDTYSYTKENAAAGGHTAKIAASDLAGHATERTWSFNVTQPHLQLATTLIYWQSYEAYLQRELTVDYSMTNSLANPVETSGSCNNGMVTHALATNGVLALGPLPVNLGNLAPAQLNSYSMIYLVPNGVTNFRATSYASCDGDAGLQFLFPQPPPM